MIIDWCPVIHSSQMILLQSETSEKPKSSVCTLGRFPLRFWSDSWSAGLTSQRVGSSLSWIEALSPLFLQPHSPIGSFSYSSLRLLMAKKSSWEPMRFVYFEAFTKKPLKRIAALPSSKVKMVGGRSMVREVVETDIDRVCLFELYISLCWRKWPWLNNHQCKGLMFDLDGVCLFELNISLC